MSELNNEPNTLAIPLTLEALLKKITPENLHGEIDFGKPVGKEITFICRVRSTHQSKT